MSKYSDFAKEKLKKEEAEITTTSMGGEDAIFKKKIGDVKKRKVWDEIEDANKKNKKKKMVDEGTVWDHIEYITDK